ncbi:MAG TPA: hypothetical protein VGH19_18925 [Verrucomicrobiae bacterium]
MPPGSQHSKWKVESAQPVDPALPPRNLIRVLTAFAVFMVWAAILTGMFDGEWTPSDEKGWDDIILSKLLLTGFAAFCARWTTRVLRRPDGKTDRIIMLICIFWIIIILSTGVVSLLPETFFPTTMVIFVLFWTPVVFWTYRKLEAKWTSDREIHPLATGVNWPADRHFLACSCFFLYTAWTMGATALSEDLPENFTSAYGIILPVIGALLAYHIGKRLLKQ